MTLVVLLHQLALQSLVLAVEDCRRLFVVFTLLPFTDNTFFSTILLKRLIAFSRFSLSSTLIVAIVFSPSSPEKYLQEFELYKIPKKMSSS